MASGEKKTVVVAWVIQEIYIYIYVFIYRYIYIYIHRLYVRRVIGYIILLF